MSQALLFETADTAVVSARPEDADRLFGALTLAFAADPAVRWMLPDPQQHLRHFPTFARAFGGRAIARRSALTSGNFTGAALWLPPDAAPDEIALSAFIAEAVGRAEREETYALFAEMARHHPAEPHWYLPLIGVEPAWQGRGLGAALLRPVLAHCDRTGERAYLESTNARNRPLYERHGFEAVAEIRVGSCPPIVPMLREPRGERATAWTRSSSPRREAVPAGA